MELVEYAQAVDHSRMPLLLRVLNALGRYASSRTFRSWRMPIAW